MMQANKSDLLTFAYYTQSLTQTHRTVFGMFVCLPFPIKLQNLRDDMEDNTWTNMRRRKKKRKKNMFLHLVFLCTKGLGVYYV